VATKFFARPFVADTIARLAQRGPGPRVPATKWFSGLPVTTESVSVATRHGEVAATVYRPAVDADDRPVYVNFHGGAFVIRHPEQDDAMCRYLAASAGVVVVNVDYDVAPAHRFPDQVEEGFDAVRWAADEARPWDGSRLCVGGQSAGGSIAAGAARLALEAGGPGIALQVLHYAPLDLVTLGEAKRAARKAVVSVPIAYIANTAYIPSVEMREDRLASPAWGSNADHLDGIAPALVITCERDRLHDEGEHYARKLDEAGALLEHVDLPGQDHGYNLLTADRAVIEHVYALIARHVTATTAGSPG